MNGPAHYREAERLLRLADTEPGLAALAQVHATLAQAAATAHLNGTLLHVHDQSFSIDDRAWVKATEVGPSRPGGAE